MKLNIENLLRIFRVVLFVFLCYNINELRSYLSSSGVYGEGTMNKFKNYKTRKVYGIEDVLSYNRDKEFRIYNLADYEPSDEVANREYVDTFKFKSLFGMYYVMVGNEMVIIWADFVDSHNPTRRFSERQLSSETGDESELSGGSGGDVGATSSQSIQASNPSKKKKTKTKQTSPKDSIKKLGAEAAAAGIRLEAVHDSEEDEPEEEIGFEEE